MILRQCSRGCEPQREPLTWSVAAWMLADGSRVAYKQKLCLTCVATTLAPLYTASEQPLMTCPSCGIDTTNDNDPVWITFVPKGLGKLRIEAPTCGPCAVKLRVWCQEGAEKLADQGSGAYGQTSAPDLSAADYWASMGIALNA